MKCGKWREKPQNHTITLINQSISNQNLLITLITLVTRITRITLIALITLITLVKILKIMIVNVIALVALAAVVRGCIRIARSIWSYSKPPSSGGHYTTRVKAKT